MTDGNPNLTRTMPEKTDPTWLVAGLLSLATIAVSLLGGMARLLHDMQDSEQPITTRDIATYLTTAMLAGIVVGGFIHHYHGWSPLLVPVAGLSGFGASQLLGLGTMLFQSVIKGFVHRVFNISNDDAKKN